ncbi:MAG: hypothetical protein HYV09_00015 [Deltaproteobacteria bacterium]|nr:hypothetical protein [Deltaproteobacteria bacterium]
MKSSAWISAWTLVAMCSVAPAASAQNSGREEGAPAPTYAPAPYAPPPTYGGPGGPAYGGPGYGGPTYASPSGPKRLPYNEGDPVPPGYSVVTRTRTGLVIGGSIVFGIFYGLTVAGASNGDTDTRWLYVPVLGPVLYGNTLDGQWAGISRFFLWIDAFCQAGGAAMLTVGLIPKTELVRNDIATVHVQPLVSPHANGLALTGTF